MKTSVSLSLLRSNRSFAQYVLLSISGLSGFLIFLTPRAQAGSPNDPRFPEQWHLRKIGTDSAWSVTTGSTDIVVAVLDTGVDYTHPDLAANMWRNPGETGLDANGKDKATNGIDDDAAWNHLLQMKRRGVNIRIVNLSSSKPFHSPTLRNAIAAVAAEGILIACSTGNRAQDDDVFPFILQSFNLSAIVPVAATTESDALWHSSDFGRSTVV